MESDETSDQLEIIFKNKAEELVARLVRETFKQELSDLFLIIKEQIESKRESDSDSEVNPAREIEMSIQNWMTELKETIRELRSIFEGRIEELVPEQLRSLFKNELIKLILETKKQIQLKKTDPDIEVDINREVKTIFENWIADKEANLTYANYKELMEKQGKVSRSPKRFTSGRLSSPFKRYSEIKEKEIEIGSKVVSEDDPNKVYTVAIITSDCLLALKAEGKHKDTILIPSKVDVL